MKQLVDTVEERLKVIRERPYLTGAYNPSTGLLAPPNGNLRGAEKAWQVPTGNFRHPAAVSLHSKIVD